MKSKIIYFIFFIGALITAAVVIAKYGSNSFAVAGVALLLFVSGYLLMSNIQEGIGKKYEDRYDEELDAVYTASQQDYVSVDEQLVAIKERIDPSNAILLDELDELSAYAKLHGDIIFKNYNEELKKKLAYMKELAEAYNLEKLQQTMNELKIILKRTIE